VHHADLVVELDQEDGPVGMRAAGHDGQHGVVPAADVLLEDRVVIGEQRGVGQVRDLAPAHEDLGVLPDEPGRHAFVDQPVLGDQVEVAGQVPLRMRAACEVEAPLLRLVPDPRDVGAHRVESCAPRGAQVDGPLLRPEPEVVDLARVDEERLSIHQELTARAGDHV
jgi:hypothetical protein